MNGPHGLRDILDFVNEGGGQASVTLLVSGWWVTGRVTHSFLFEDWVAEVSTRAHRERSTGGFRVPSMRVADPTPEAIVAATDRWNDLKSRATADENAREQFEALRNVIALRNSTARCSTGQILEAPWLAVDFPAVSAWTLIGSMADLTQ